MSASPRSGVVDGVVISGPGETLDVIDPSDGSTVETVGLAGPAEVEAAVEAVS